MEPRIVIAVVAAVVAATTLVLVPVPSAAALPGSALPGLAPTGAADLGARDLRGRAWGWPVAGWPRLLRRFDPPARPWLSGHRGVDLAAAVGDPVRAAGPGVVTVAGDLAGRGVVVVSHGALRTTYEPVSPQVRVGDAVRRGELLGTITLGASHCGQWPTCLHWGLRRGRDYLDPLLLVGGGTVVLLPGRVAVRQPPRPRAGTAAAAPPSCAAGRCGSPSRPGPARSPPG